MSNTEDQLPDGWALASLKEIGTWTGGGTPSKRQPAYWTDGTIPWVSPKDMKTDFISESEDAITERAVDESSAKLVEAGSVLFVTRSGILRHTLPVAVSRVDVTVNQDLKALTPASGIDPTYVLRFVQAFNHEVLHATSKGGTTVQSVQTKKLHDYPILIAPTPEQLRIVDALESALADLDAGVAAIETAQRDLERYRQSVLKAAVEGDLTADWRRQHPNTEPASLMLDRVLEKRRELWEADQLASYKEKSKTPPKNWRSRYKPPPPLQTDDLPDLPTGWVWAPFGALCEHRLGKMLDKQKNVGTLRPYLRNVNVRWNEFDLDDLLEMRIEDDELDKYTVRQGDLVICEGGEPGRAAIWRRDEPICYQKALHRARPYLGVSSQYLLLFLEQAAISGTLAAYFTGSTINHLTGKALAVVPVPLPPFEEQISIVDAVDERLSVADASALELDRQRARADRLRRAVLKRAFAGELVPQDPSDEPASVLLERVQQELAERRKTKTTRKRKRTMSKPDPTPPASLVEIVKAEGPIEPRDLWKRSGIESIDAFYAALKVEVAEKRLGEEKRSDTERRIVLA